jgi:molybdate transport system regulatory protein
LRLERGGEHLFDETRIALLEGIAATGSITKAGKAAGVSYRTAWLAVDHLNALADEPLVERSQGGARGGGTWLTPYGERMIAVYRAVQKEHAGCLGRLRAGIADFDRFLRLTRKISLRTSARNQFFGTVAAIRTEPLSAEVTLRLKGRDRIRARITREGLESLGLRVGDEACALIKANWIELRHASGSGRKSAMPPGAGPSRAEGNGPAGPANLLRGVVADTLRSGARCEVAVNLAGGNTLVTVADGYWKTGDAAAAAFRPEDVILGVAG